MMPCHWTTDTSADEFAWVHRPSTRALPKVPLENRKCFCSHRSKLSESTAARKDLHPADESSGSDRVEAAVLQQDASVVFNIAT